MATPGIGLANPVPGAPPSTAIEPSPGPALVLTWEDGIKRALNASGLVRRARAITAAVSARHVGAGIALPANPLIAIGAGLRRDSTSGTRIQSPGFSAHAEQSFEIAGQRSTRREQVAREIDVANWRARVADNEVRARFRSVYVGTQLAEAQLQATIRRVALIEQLVDSIGSRVTAGASSSVDLHLARVEKGRAVREKIAAALALASAQSELHVLLDLEPSVTITLATQLDMPMATAEESSPGALGNWIARARKDRAELKSLTASQEAFDAELVRLRREAIPNPTLFLDFQRELPGQIYMGGGVAVSIPTWRRNQGDIAINRAERNRAMDEQIVTDREIVGEVERAFRAVSAQTEMVRTMESDVLPAAESAVDLITQGWRAGKFDLFRVIQASREASEARRNHLESVGALWEASIALRRAAGAL